MSENLYIPNILRVNAVNQRIGWSCAKDAFAAMMGGVKGSAPYLGIDFQYELDADGNPKYDCLAYQSRLTWEEWIKLPIRPWDKFIQGVRQPIRIPTVVVCPNFARMPRKEQRATPSAIRRRDGNRCQYTGVELTNKTFSLDHVIPRSKGGRDNWQNLVAAHKDVNSAKGNKFNHEVGLKLAKKPIAPLSLPLCAIYTENKHPDHVNF